VTPPKASRPTFVCPQNWTTEVKSGIAYGLTATDSKSCARDRNDDTLYQTSPMSVVRCSRGGKTRALYEIANLMEGWKDDDEIPLARIYVSFNDNTTVQIWEQEDPLQALLRRIAFAASVDKVSSTNEGKEELFNKFLDKKPVWEIDSFLKWIDDAPCLLLIDQLNNLNALTKRNSDAAEDFGLFLQRHFIGKKNRYLVFSSHLLGANVFFREYVDRSNGSCRSIILQELPIVSSLQEATSLKPSLDSTREAVYYGLVPGMIYEAQKDWKKIVGKRETRVKEALEKRSNDLDCLFRSILKSLVDGTTKVGEDLGILVDSAKEELAKMIKFVGCLSICNMFWLRWEGKNLEMLNLLDKGEKVDVCLYGYDVAANGGRVVSACQR